MLLPILASAEPVEVDGLNYLLNEEEKTATVTSSNYKGVLVIPEAIKVENVDYVVTAIDDYAFRENNNLISVTIPASVKTIGMAAFTSCITLSSVKIGDGVEEIGHRAFCYCVNLQAVHIGKKVKKINDGVFLDCNSLNQIYISDMCMWFNIDFYSESSNPLTYAHHIYHDKREIKDLIVPEGIDVIKQYAFIGGSNIKSLALNNSVKRIDYCAFSGCSSLNTVSFPESISYIGRYAFNGCTNLEELILPEGITTINDYSFSGCTNLKKVELPQSLLLINSGAFDGCTGLKNITIPSNVELINTYAFNFSSTENVYFFLKEDYPPTTYENSFPSNSKFYVPDSSIEPYQNVEPWSSFDIHTFSGSGPEKCAAPVVSYKNGVISFSSETPDVEFHYAITSADGQKNVGNSLDISGNCVVSVYASKKGYEDSETVTSEINIIGKQGDVNRDGQVNVADHVKLSEIIMGQTNAGHNE